MSSAYKTSKAELVAIYRLEFYRQKKNWKFCQDVHKEKEPKQKDPKQTKHSKKKSAAEIQRSAKKQLNETYVVETPAARLDEAFLESESDTNLAKEPTTESKNEPKEPRTEPKEPRNELKESKDQPKEPTSQPKDELKGWTNSKRNIALTSILQSEAFRLTLITDPEVQDLTDGPTWPEAGDETSRMWTADVGDIQPQTGWSEEIEWQESHARDQVYQPELWSPTREDEFDFTRDKVWSKEDQIWPQSPKSWPEPVIWRDNELVWPAASQQAQKVDDTKLQWLAATHQGPRKCIDVELWPAESQQNGAAKLMWPDDVQQGRTEVRPEMDLQALSPEVLVSTAEEWLHDPLADDRSECGSAGSAGEGLRAFMVGAHRRPHSSELDLASAAPVMEPNAATALSQSALCACVRRHAGLLHALLCEARARDQVSSELENYAQSTVESSSYEEYPTRDVGLQGPAPKSQGPAPTLQGGAATLRPAPTFQRPPPTLQGPASAFQGPASTFQGSASTFQGSASTSQLPPPIFQKPPPLQGSTPTFQGPASTFQGSASTLQLPPPIFQKPPPLQGSTPTFQGPASTLQGPAPTFQGSPPTLQGSAPTFQGPAPTFQGTATNFHAPPPTFQGPATTLQGHTRTPQGPAPTFQGPATTLQETPPTFPGPAPTFPGPAPKQAPKQPDNFISGSFLNNPYFDLETSISAPDVRGPLAQGPGRGRGRLVKDDRVIGVGLGGGRARGRL